MKTYSIIITCLWLALVYACQSPEQRAFGDTALANNKDAVDSNATTLNAAEKSFAEKASISSFMEEEFATKMLKTTENPDVQNLATIMLKEHKQANTELANIAKKLRIQLPRTIPADKQSLLDKFEDMEEYEKNLTYTNLMVKEHKKAITIFTEGTKVNNKDLSAFAKAKLPRLKKHLQEAKRVQDIMLKIKNDKGDIPLKRSNDNDKNYQRQQ